MVRFYKRAAGLFYSCDEAEAAIHALKDDGYEIDKVSLLARKTDDVNDAEEVTDTEGADAGATTGAVLGGIGGFLVGAGGLAIPGVGPVLAAGVGFNFKTTVSTFALMRFELTPEPYSV